MTELDIPVMGLTQLLAFQLTGDWEALGHIVRIVDTGDGCSDGPDTWHFLQRLPLITFTTGASSGMSTPALDAAVDMVVPPSWVGAVAHRVGANPQAALVLAHLTRATQGMAVEEAITLESFAYASLQSGQEFARWLAAETPRSRRTGQGQVIVREWPDAIEVILDRPYSANAINAHMRAQLESVLSALILTTGPIRLRGEGRHFCAGGDLSEFGLVDTPVTGHLSRMQQNLPAAVARLADRLTVHVHGACVGAGLELSSFASRVTASPGTTWCLPETSMGLLPGCGGTVSISRRIGRQNMLLFALSDKSIDVTQALAWGLIDAVIPGP